MYFTINYGVYGSFLGFYFQQAHYDSIDEYSTHLAKFLNYYNYEKKLKSLKFKSPYDKILERYQEKPDLFLGDPLYYCKGLNI